MSIRKGEFVTIIGDIGSGKSSLLQSVVGDLIYVPQAEIDHFGGLDREASQEEFDELKGRVLSEDFNIEKKPIMVRGSVSYVE